MCVEVRGQLGGRSLMWVFPVTGGGEAPGGLKAFSLTCPAKSSVREDFEVWNSVDLLLRPVVSPTGVWGMVFGARSSDYTRRMPTLLRQRTLL